MELLKKLNMETTSMHFKYDIRKACRVILQEHFERFGISGNITASGGMVIEGPLSSEKYRLLETDLKKYGIEIIVNSRSVLVQQIREAVTDWIYYSERNRDITLSAWIAEKLNMSYSHLSRIFSEETCLSIENYMIRQRIERARQLILLGTTTLTEIAWKLNYSSVAHLSNQFKKVTGLTPTQYQKQKAGDRQA